MGFQQQIFVAWNIHDEYLGYILRLHGTLRSDASHSGSRVACLAESAEMGSEEAFEITDLVIYQPADEAGGKWAKGIQNNGPWDFWRNEALFWHTLFKSWLQAEQEHWNFLTILRKQAGWASTVSSGKWILCPYRSLRIPPTYSWLASRSFRSPRRCWMAMLRSWANRSHRSGVMCTSSTCASSWASRIRRGHWPGMVLKAVKWRCTILGLLVPFEV